MTKTKLYWPIIRTIIFIILGLMNTVFIRSEDIGTLKNYIGYAFLVLAVIGIIQFANQLKKRKQSSSE